MKRENVRDYVQSFLLEGSVHKNYEHTVELAAKYRKMVTGENLDDMLEQIVSREDSELFKQRKKITKHIVPSVLNSVKMPFYKVCRTIPLIRQIDWDEGKGKVEEKKVEIEGSIIDYWGGRTLSEFMEWGLVDYAMVDPNAFVVTDFKEFDSRVEKAEPYPVIYRSSQVIDYSYTANTLNYLSVCKDIQVLNGDKKSVEKQYFIYISDYSFRVTPIGDGTELGRGDILQYGERRWLLEEFYHGSKSVPAQRIGYIPDLITNGETVVSIFHAAIPLLEKTLKINSELDLSAAMVAFPQRFAYSQPCQEPTCNKGFSTVTGKSCEVCGGTGVAQRHGSTADVIELPLPNNPEDMIDLSRLLHYVMPPIELLRFQDEYIEKMKVWVYSTIFNSDIFTRSEISETATAKILEADNMNDTLYPFARHYSHFWQHSVELIADFTDLGEGITVEHKFPHSIKFKGLGELMSELRTAKDSGASSGTIAAIEDDINEILYIDRPDELNKIRIKNSFNPFRGFDAQQINLTIGMGRTTRYNEILYLNSETIFQELERENETWVYDLPLNAIEIQVKKKVEEIIARIDAESPTVKLPFRDEV